jgi:hypothetical protein
MLPALTSGCSVINIYDDGVKVSSYIGLPIYSLESNGGAVYFDITGLGFITSPSGASFGYVQQVYAQIPTGTCSIVFFTRSEKQSAAVIASLKKSNIDPSTVCLTHNKD